MKPKYVIAYPLGGRPVPCDWHLAVRSLMMPTNVRVTEMHTRSYEKDGKMTIPLEKAQTDLVDRALEIGAEYILFIEDDTIPPPSALMELSRVLETAEESVMVCGGVYTTRANPPEPILYKKYGDGAFWNWKLGDIVPCLACGMGCTLIKLKVFQMMSKPWFRELKTLEEVNEFPELFPDAEQPGINKKGGCSTDIFFYTKLASMGFKVLAHGGVLPIHWDIERNEGYWLPRGMPPTEGILFNGKEFGWTDPALESIT